MSSLTYGRTHGEKRTWSVGGGGEYRTYKRLWTRVDYAYGFFPSFCSFVSGEFHTLKPDGITFGETYHFRESDLLQFAGCLPLRVFRTCGKH